MTEENGITEVENTRTISYFAADGSYGDAAGLTVMETTHWSELDWEIIDQVGDYARPVVARLLTESYEEDADNELIKQKLIDYGVDPASLEPVSSDDTK
jgi:hypothetical protein